MGASLLGAVALVSAVWYLIINPQNSPAYQFVFLALVILLLAVVVLAGVGFFGLVLTLWFSKPAPFLQRPIHIAINIFFPLVIAIGKILRIDMDRIRNSFVQVNNQLVKARGLRLKPREVLLLAPHCLQRSTCSYKITGNIDNCRRCGKCAINSLLEMRDKYGINIGVATGGTLARKYVKDYRPKAIVAIACERDLTSGILDANPIPVLGVTNIRPNGPCNDTCISVTKVEEAIQQLVGSGVKHEEPFMCQGCGT